MRFGHKMVAQSGGSQKRNGIVDAEGEESAAVAHGGECKVGKGEDGAALTDTAAIEMVCGYVHFGASHTFAHIGEPHSIHMGKTVCVIKFFQKCHCITRRVIVLEAYLRLELEDIIFFFETGAASGVLQLDSAFAVEPILCTDGIIGLPHVEVCVAVEIVV